MELNIHYGFFAILGLNCLVLGKRKLAKTVSITCVSLVGKLRTHPTTFTFIFVKQP